jgi:flagellar hook-associated protein 3 FlgL
MFSRIGTFANATSLIDASMRLQAKLADQQAQEASSFKSTTFSGLGGDASRVLNIEGQSARLQADNTAASGAAALVQGAFSAVGDIANLATQIRTQLASALSGLNAASSGATTSTDAATWLSTLQGALNTEVAGAFVFGGQAADRAPADFSAAGYAPTASPATPDTGYYQGSATPRSLTTSDGVTVQLGAAASDPGFEQLARAISLVAANPTSATTLQSAFDLVGSAISDLTATQATLANQASTLDTLSSTNNDKITTLNNLATTLDGADLATAAVLVSQYQTQLQAVFSTIGQLSSNSILKFLGG